jgi:hypothetical protein
MATEKPPKSRKPHPNSLDYGKHVHMSLKAAFSLIKKSMNEGLYMPAYVTAFSIVEDRLFAMYVVGKRVTEGVKDVKRNYRDSLLKCADYLIEQKHLEKSMKKILEKQFDLRNKRFHGAMWRLDEFTEKNTQVVIDLARQMTDMRKFQKKKFGIGFVTKKID